MHLYKVTSEKCFHLQCKSIKESLHKKFQLQQCVRSDNIHASPAYQNLRDLLCNFGKSIAYLVSVTAVLLESLHLMCAFDEEYALLADTLVFSHLLRFSATAEDKLRNIHIWHTKFSYVNFKMSLYAWFICLQCSMYYRAKPNRHPNS